MWDVNFIQYLARSAPIWKPPLQFQPNCTNLWNVLMQHWCRVGGWKGGGSRPKSSNRLQSCTPLQALSAGSSPTGRGDSFNDRSWKRSDELATTSAHEEVLPGLAAQSSEVRSTFVGFCALSRQWHQREMKEKGRGRRAKRGDCFSAMWPEDAAQGQDRRVSFSLLHLCPSEQHLACPQYNSNTRPIDSLK